MNIHKVVVPPTGEAIEDDSIYLVKTSKEVKIGVATADGSELIFPKPYVTLQGPTALFHTEPGVYTINDYTDLITYTVTSTDGDISRIGSTITFTVNNTELTSASFTVNGRVFTIDVNAIALMAPAIVAPTDGATDVPLTGTVVTASPMLVNYAGVSDTHVSSDWELSTDPEFTTIVASSYDDTVNKTEWTIPV